MLPWRDTPQPEQCEGTAAAVAATTADFLTADVVVVAVERILSCALVVGTRFVCILLFRVKKGAADVREAAAAVASNVGRRRRRNRAAGKATDNGHLVGVVDDDGIDIDVVDEDHAADASGAFDTAATALAVDARRAAARARGRSIVRRCCALGGKNDDVDCGGRFI